MPRREAQRTNTNTHPILFWFLFLQASTHTRCQLILIIKRPSPPRLLDAHHHEGVAAAVARHAHVIVDEGLRPCSRLFRTT
jgi:hypothetical protein